MSVAERTPVAEILDRAVSGERITDEDAVELLRSRDLLAVGRAANEIRNRLHDPERVTYIIDRNINYTNVCVTDCDFCAFYRGRATSARATCCRSRHLREDRGDDRPRRHGACCCRAAITPTSAIDCYEDLFRSIKARYPIHLHALSPAEIAAHRAALEADACRRRSRGCATPASTRSRAAAPRSSSTACAASSRRKKAEHDGVARA